MIIFPYCRQENISFPLLRTIKLPFPFCLLCGFIPFEMHTFYFAKIQLEMVHVNACKNVQPQPIRPKHLELCF